MTIIISIEGNIGSGKSTIVKLLENIYGKSKSICFLDEPVSKWLELKDSNNKNILNHFYENIEEYAFPFQMNAYISRLKILSEALEKGYDMIITERCHQTDKYVFAKMLYEDNKIKEINYLIYLEWFDYFIKDIPEVHHIYIKTNPNIAYERVKKRNRESENNITLEYLEKCNESHDDWLLPLQKKIIINGDFDNNNTDYQVNLQVIKNYIESMIGM